MFQFRRSLTSNSSSSSPSNYHIGKANNSNGDTKKSNSLASHKPILFDIKLASPYKNMVLILEDGLESTMCNINGHLVLSLPSNLTVKKINLKLLGNFKLDFIQTGKKNGVVTNIIKENRPIFQISWDNLLCASNGKCIIEGEDKIIGVDVQQRVDANPSTNSIVKKSLSTPVLGKLSVGKSKKSSGNSSFYPVASDLTKDNFLIDLQPSYGTPLCNGNVTSAFNRTFNLNKGNYELPFTMEIPSDLIPCTVEGLQAASVLYKMIAVIDTVDYGKIYKIKYIRIFKSLKPNNFSIQEEMYVGKNWPEKLQYEISIPSKAIPIGGKTPISITLHPFQKNYKLLKIEATLIQYYAIKDQSGSIFENSSNVLHLVMNKFGKSAERGLNEDNELIDEVKINSLITIPNNLRNITQDCNINKNGLIRVRHKFRIRIHLGSPAAKTTSSSGSDSSNDNSNAKKTEITANIPVILFISPHTFTLARKVILDNQGNIHFRHGDSVSYFKSLGPSIINNRSSGNDSYNTNNTITLADGSYQVKYFPDEELQAPPTYNERIHDIIFFNQNGLMGGNTGTGLCNNSGVTVPCKTPASDNGDSVNNRESLLLNQDYFNFPHGDSSDNNTLPNTPNSYDTDNISMRHGRDRNITMEELNRLPTYEETMDNDEDDPGMDSDCITPLSVNELSPGYTQICRR
ncbi:uncharacterized protein SCODWIG_03847 [Saccharomycodes ludwigii]|uniref:Arrestin C-terminal-like domain-containing protein n=1 Tax=Saccharomycodes ludwigii TaxID=36035 RepID=A0A376BBL5_9ASCO|nr:hypothetical protein SCDLUD_005251 [Saccharomycodes ludwigii]KAH3898907.1 hypothetical protein SCDLUD_005251 [Saccharomycodes ludwigii]SSD62085.1 uncharacterized protein SCODWIG_03847 [Saccharomycodes ludwigii]